MTQLAASGVDLRTRMNGTGHKSAKLALELYEKADPVADRAEADTVGTHVLTAMPHMERTEPVSRGLPQVNSIFEQVVYV